MSKNKWRRGLRSEPWDTPICGVREIRRVHQRRKRWRSIEMVGKQRGIFWKPRAQNVQRRRRRK